MAGQLKVGGNIIASHSGVEGAGEVTLQNVTLGDSAVPSHSMNFRNLIINGAMQVWQRGTSATGLTATDFTTVDRFMANYGGGVVGGTRSVERWTDVPSGFNYSIKVTHSGSSATPNEYALRTFLEMQNIKHLIGKTAVYSFYYKSNRTGTHAYRFAHNSITGASDINGEFTVNSANTWERKEIIITQLVNGTGTSTSDVAWGIHLDCGPIMYGEGLASFDDGDYFAVTGVQLEIGTVATPFEHRPYGIELALCQRYFQAHYTLGAGVQNSTAVALVYCSLPVTMRRLPDISTRSGVYTNINVEHDDTYDVTGVTNTHGITTGQRIEECSSFTASVSTTGTNTVGYGVCVMCDRNSDAFTFDAEF